MLVALVWLILALLSPGGVLGQQEDLQGQDQEAVSPLYLLNDDQDLQGELELCSPVSALLISVEQIY